MRRQTLNMLFTPLLAVSLLLQYLSLCDWTGRIGHEIHEINGWIFIGLIIVHLILNLPWIMGTYFRRRRRPPVTGG